MTHNSPCRLALAPSRRAPTAAAAWFGSVSTLECVFALPSFVCWFENGQYFRKVARARDVRYFCGILSPHALFKRIHFRYAFGKVARKVVFVASRTI